MGNNKYKIKEPYAGWLDEFVGTHEAAQITGVPAASLITLRSRGGGPNFVNPKKTRIIRYQRQALFEWMLSTGVHTNTASCQEFKATNDNKEEDA